MKFNDMPFRTSKRYLLEVSDTERNGFVSYISAHWIENEFGSYEVDGADFLEGKEILRYAEFDEVDQ
jgi:hypothetical protein